MPADFLGFSKSESRVEMEPGSSEYDWELVQQFKDEITVGRDGAAPLNELLQLYTGFILVWAKKAYRRVLKLGMRDISFDDLVEDMKQAFSIGVWKLSAEIAEKKGAQTITTYITLWMKNRASSYKGHMSTHDGFSNRPWMIHLFETALKEIGSDFSPLFLEDEKMQRKIHLTMIKILETQGIDFEKRWRFVKKMSPKTFLYFCAITWLKIDLKPVIYTKFGIKRIQIKKF